ncbi:MAG: diphthine--ammonia ligase [Candidatus Micrarchaeota archaeon]|nr:diphthine--ammonia ligase [Candidatus Micrarchaeota archaeon]
MHVVVLFSGGKDSVFATFWALTHGFDVTLVTVKAEEDSTMFHHPNIDKTKLQAKALGLKQVFVTTNENNWHEDLKEAIKKLEIGGLVGGAIASEYQKRRFERICEELGIVSYSPLWHKGDELLQEMINYFEIYVTAVAAEGLGPELLGEPFKKLLGKRANVHKFLEGGEGETFVANAPFFKKAIKIKKWKKTWDGVRGNAEIEKTG